MTDLLAYWAAPCMRFMMHRRLPVKFALVTAAFLTPILILLTVVIQYSNDGIQFAEQERIGVQYLQLMQPVLRSAIDGNGKSLPLSELQQRNDADHDALQLQNALTTLSKAGNNQIPDALLATYTDLGDSSNLILDPDLDSYYIMIVALDLSPKLALAQSRLAKLLANSAAGEPLSGVAVAQVTFLNTRITDYQNAITHALQRAGKTTPELKQRFDSAWQQTSNALIDATEVSPDRALPLAKQAMEQSLKLNATTLAVLEELLSKRIAELQHKRNLNLLITLAGLVLAAYLITGFYLSDIRGFGALTKRMQRLASGNLVEDFGAQGKDEIGQLINAFEATRAQLQVLVKQIHESAQTITSAGNEIASSNLDLSKRTAEQANMVGAAAVQINAITEKIHANLEAAASANSISLEAFKETEKGKQVMDRVVSTMGEMKGSSTKIGAIIGVINEIAFQTNLLALNAAVEAARAGEQGRGFAVVAGEVRNLAQRCANAANEITQLIKTSVSDVNNGVVQVDTAGKSMVEILDSVQTVSSIMGEMVDAGRAQTQSTHGIEATVRRIEEDAAQNAAMVEQTASAADLLRQQVDVLMEAIGRFNVGSSNITSATTPHGSGMKHSTERDIDHVHRAA